MTDVPTLTDGWVVLDALQHDDAAAMVAADDEATRWAWGRDEPLTLDTAWDLIHQAEAGWTDGSKHWWAMRRTGRDHYVGRLDLWPAHEGEGGRIGVIVAPDHRRARIARRAVQLGTRYAFDVLDWPFLFADILPGNAASLRLANSMGFRRWPGELPTVSTTRLAWWPAHPDGELRAQLQDGDGDGEARCDIGATERRTRAGPVPVDLYPGDCPNHLRVGDTATIKVAVVGRETLPASRFDSASARLKGVRPLRWSTSMTGASRSSRPCHGSWSCSNRSTVGSRMAPFGSITTLARAWGSRAGCSLRRSTRWGW